jgi:RimJ/RimL family protein N-acetyltransferase
MVSIRHFTDGDADTIRFLKYPDMTTEEIRGLIHEWNTFSYQGKYFEMFAVISEGTIVGLISLAQHSQTVASIGIETFEPFRRSGYAYEAMLLLLDHAKRLGYKIIQNQVRVNNAASISLHEKLLFKTDRSIHKTRKGNPCYLFSKVL